MEKEELVRIKHPVSYRSLDPPRPTDKPGIPVAPYPRAGVEPSAPPQELMDVGPGTDGSSAGHEHFPILYPPNAAALQAEERILYISEDEARDAFVQFAASKCCYRTGPAKQMVVRSLAALNTYRYQLQTFTESRSTLPASQPYKGGLVDSLEIAVPPGPWDIVVDPPPLFTDCKIHLPVPHTYKVEGCPDCSRTGSVLCSRCRGSGRRTCGFCGGSGRFGDYNNHYSGCSLCNGSGEVCCPSCHWKGWVPCARCDKRGLLLCHLELTVTWKNNVTEYVVDKNQGFPLSRFQEVTGKELFSEEHHLVTPLNLPQPIVQGAESCLALHQMQVSEETRILRQKHAVEIIPLTKVDYDWEGKTYSFYVFGNEKQVYAKGYPGRCCCALL